MLAYVLGLLPLTDYLTDRDGARARDARVHATATPKLVEADTAVDMIDYDAREWLARVTHDKSLLLPAPLWIFVALVRFLVPGTDFHAFLRVPMATLLTYGRRTANGNVVAASSP